MAKIEFTAFAEDEASIKALTEFTEKEAARDPAWKTAKVIKGNIRDAAKHLSGNPCPLILAVDLASVETAFADLDELANHCEPGTRVFVLGEINEFSFFKKLSEMGVNDYLLKPISTSEIERVFKKPPASAAAAPAEGAKKEQKGGIISVVGTRGGVGSTTIAVNLAATLASKSGLPTAILDFDPEFGTACLMLDVEPSRGLVDALEKPDRVDTLFLDRVMSKVSDNLFIMGAEKTLSDVLRINDKAPEIILSRLKQKYPFVIVDITRINPFTRHFLQNSTDNILVTELSLSGLRDAMRIYDLIKGSLSNGSVTFVANKVGLAKKYQVPVKDFEEQTHSKLSFQIPFEPDIYGFSDSGKILVDSNKTCQFTKTINSIAAKYLPESAEQAKEPAKKGGIFGALKK